MLFLVGTILSFTGTAKKESVSDSLFREARASGFASREMAVPDSFREAGALNASAYWLPESPMATRTYSGELVALSDPFTDITPLRDGIVRYKVQRGDTLASLADRFSVSQDTIRWANPSIGKKLSPGTELIVLPVSGVLYTVGAGDSLESIATYYHIDPETIRAWNPSYQQMLADGGTLVLANAKPPVSRPSSKSSKKQLPKANLMMPAEGWNWGELHESGAVDIANQCGTPVVAAADGIVIPDTTYGDGVGGWNGGYGLFVLIEHPDGIRTRYAHLSEITVSVGTMVTKGRTIGRIGNTGATHGPTGCHLHFEVAGAENPFVLR